MQQKWHLQVKKWLHVPTSMNLAMFKANWFSSLNNAYLSVRFKHDRFHYVRYGHLTFKVMIFYNYVRFEHRPDSRPNSGTQTLFCCGITDLTPLTPFSHGAVILKRRIFNWKWLPAMLFWGACRKLGEWVSGSRPLSFKLLPVLTRLSIMWIPCAKNNSCQDSNLGYLWTVNRRSASELNMYLHYLVVRTWV